MTHTYLITGGAGFIGSHLVETFILKGHPVLVLDNLSTGSKNNIAHLINNPLFDFTHADISDVQTVDRLAARADVIIHMAAAVGVQLIVERPVYTIETNIIGTESVLKAAVRHKCTVLLASTSEVYGKGSKIPFCEDDDVLLGATRKSRWAYAASKMVDEFLGFAYMREKGLDVISFRLFNTVGPRQTGRYGMVIPRFVSQALRGEPITVYGEGTQTRCFCDVRDIVRAVIGLAGDRGARGEVFNIGSTEEISIHDLAKKIKSMTGSNSPIKLVPYSEAYMPGFEDMQRRVPNTSKIRSLIGWRPEYSLDEILTNIINSLK